MSSKSAYLQGWIPYAKKRYITYGIITIVALILPFITIGGKHLFLLSFDKKQLHLLFTAFDMQEMYLMPFLLIILFLSIFFMTTLGGRVWCGWGCPQTIFTVFYRDLIQTKLLKIRTSIANKQKNPTKKSFKKLISILIWIFLSFLIASNFMWYFVPPEDFFVYIKDPQNHTVLLSIVASIAIFISIDVIYLKEKFCVYVCPYARVQSVMYDDDTIQAIYNTKRGGDVFDAKGIKMWKKPETQNAECIGCEACVHICPTHIDIRKGMQLECINCLECVDACTKIMAAFSKPSLVTWTSPNEVSGGKTKYFRFRTIAYGVALGIVFVALMFMSTKKEHMLLNINRTTELYKIQDDGKTVQNAYTFLFQNTDSKDHRYFFEVNDKRIKIERPKEEFKLRAGQKAKKVVVLETKDELVKTDKKDTPISIVIKAFAVDEKAKITILREATFVYPRQSEFKKHNKD